MNLRRYRALQTPARSDGYRIKNEGSKAILYLYDVIDSSGWFGVSASDFVRDLVALDVDAIDLHINSPGGDVYDAIAMYNSLKQHKATVTTYIDGIAASAASYLALAGDQVIIARNAEMMIHDAWGFCSGNAQDFARYAKDLDRVSSNIADIYAQKAGGKQSEWRDAMLAETWYSHDEAVAAGLADSVLDSDFKAEFEEMSAKFDLGMFAYANRGSAPTPYMPERKAAMEENEPEPAGVAETIDVNALRVELLRKAAARGR